LTACYNLGMTTDRNILQTRELLDESRALMARLGFVRAEMEEARARTGQAARDSRQVAAEAYEKLASLPAMDASENPAD
jgi:hypothetical protein